MRKHILRALCIAFVLTLCLPMAACDFQFGGLVGELLANNAPGGGVVPDQWESDLVIEDILTDIEVETEIAIESAWIDEVFTGDIYTEMPTEDITYDHAYDTTQYHTTEPPMADTPSIAPLPDPVVVCGSFDELYTLTKEQREDVFAPGAAYSWNGIANVSNYETESIKVRGWVGFFAEDIGQFGYQIDGGEPVMSDAFTLDTEQPVLDAAMSAGARSASRYKVTVPIRDLSGEHTITILAKDAQGNCDIIKEFTLIKAVDPYAPVNVPIEYWTVSGHCPIVVDVSRPEYYPMLQAGGIEQGALLHQGSVGIGEFDLSQYEKMIVYYGIDNSEFSVENYNNNPSNRIMITNAEIHMINYPLESDIIASTVYTLQGWQVVPIEIDLTGVEYNGSVYVTYDTLPGTFMVIGAIYLVPYAE